MESIDLKCAGYGSQLAEGDAVEQSLINATLSVLLEQGLYATYLFLCLRGEKDEPAAKHVRQKLYELMCEYFPDMQSLENDIDKQSLLKSVLEKFQDQAEGAFLAKDILEKTLTYARYHLKANKDRK